MDPGSTKPSWRSGTLTGFASQEGIRRLLRSQPRRLGFGHRTRRDPGAAVRTYHGVQSRTLKTGTFYLAPTKQSGGVGRRCRWRRSAAEQSRLGGYRADPTAGQSSQGFPSVPLVNSDWLTLWELHLIRKLLEPMSCWLAILLAGTASVLKTRAALQLENIALRHQIGVLQRSMKKRPRLHAVDFAVARVDGLAFAAGHRQARNSSCMAPQGFPRILGVEDSEG